MPPRLRVAAIDFLNPAPLMFDFEHPPLREALAERYELHYTLPSRCATELLEGRADLGLIPIAALTPALAIVPGCTIASLDEVRSIQLIVKMEQGRLRAPHSLRPLTGESLLAKQTLETSSSEYLLSKVHSIAADTASLSSVAYAQVLFQRFIGSQPAIVPAAADPLAMLALADAALLIGDPALLALEARDQIEAAAGPCLWLDLAHEWRARTGLPWVAAVWALRPEALARSGSTAAQIAADLNLSRDHGLGSIDQLVAEWTPRIALSPDRIRDYLTRNIHYILSPECIAAITLFRRYAAEGGILAPLPALTFA